MIEKSASFEWILTDNTGYNTVSKCAGGCFHPDGWAGSHFEQEQGALESTMT